jgi:hypothetical protein
MHEPFDDQLPEDFRSVARLLRDQRAQTDAVELDRLKRRTLNQYSGQRGRLTFMRSRIATVFAVVGLVGGTGGALAVAGGGGGGGGNGGNGGAGYGQYCPPKFKHHHKCVRPRPPHKPPKCQKGYGYGGWGYRYGSGAYSYYYYGGGGGKGCCPTGGRSMTYGGRKGSGGGKGGGGCYGGGRPPKGGYGRHHNKRHSKR